MKKSNPTMFQKENKTTFLLFALVCLILSASISCEKEKAEPVVVDDKDTVVQKTLCDTVNFTYTTDIKPIITANCSFSGCHGNGSQSGGVNLNSYANVVNEAQQAQFLGAIKHESGFSSMPQGRSKLSNSQIEAIECWIDQNTPE